MMFIDKNMVVFDGQEIWNVEKMMQLCIEGTNEVALFSYFEARKALAKHRNFLGFAVFESKDFNNFLDYLYEAIEKETGKDLTIETDVLNLFKGCRLPQRGRYLKDFLETEKIKL